MKSLFTTLIILLSFIVCLQAQSFSGGTFSVNYNNGLYIDIAPEVGYEIKNKFRIGASPFFLYNEKNDIENFSYGARSFGQYTIFEDIFVHVEIQLMKIQTIKTTLSGEQSMSKWVVSFPVGGGYRYKIAENTYAHGMVLYDFFLDENSPQKNPMLRGGITYKF